MITNSFNICPTCAHLKYCVLTEMKEKVWSCSEYDEAKPEAKKIKISELPVRELEMA